MGADDITGQVYALRRNNLSLSCAMGGRDDKKGLWGYFGVLYNQFLIDRSYFASVSAGVAFTYRVYNKFTSAWGAVGLPIEAKAFFRVFPCLGVGAILFTNINCLMSIIISYQRQLEFPKINQERCNGRSP
jgi:hypothetical protein